MAQTILLVDDNEDVRYSIVAALLDQGGDYEFKEVAGGKECLSLLESGFMPDLILLDIMMPEIDGWDVAAKIHADERWFEIPIIFLTAKGDDFSKAVGGFSSVDYIVKPFEPDDLKQRIDDVLSSAE